MLKLYYTPKSHYARKDRILIDALNLEVELIDAGNVADQDPGIFANNPLMKVPTLIDEGQNIFESDHIAEYLVRKHDVEDQFDVLSHDPKQKNLQAVLNGVMAAEVELIMAERTGIDTRKYTRFDKFRSSVTQGLQWLENNADDFSNEPDYRGFHLVCLWDHLDLYKMFELDYPNLKRLVAELNQLDFVYTSQP